MTNPAFIGFDETSIVIGYWSFIGHRLVHTPERTQTGLITGSDQTVHNQSLFYYFRAPKYYLLVDISNPNAVSHPDSMSDKGETADVSRF